MFSPRVGFIFELRGAPREDVSDGLLAAPDLISHVGKTSEQIERLLPHVFDEPRGHPVFIVDAVRELLGGLAATLAEAAAQPTVDADALAPDREVIHVVGGRFIARVDGLKGFPESST